MREHARFVQDGEPAVGRFLQIVLFVGRENEFQHGKDSLGRDVVYERAVFFRG